jgi:outer membrane protein OmpA-like peptidoglycan-associated protein
MEAIVIDCPSLPISPFWPSEEHQRIVLVGSFDARRLCGDGDYETVPPSKAASELDSISPTSLWQMRRFVAQAGLFAMDVRSLADGQLVEVVRAWIRRGDLVGVKRVGTGESTDATVEQRQLVRQIETATRGRLNEAGRQYKVVPGSDLASVADRDSYQVVSRDDARRVLDALARVAVGGALKVLLLEARDKLTPDWRPPLSPSGLVLLRKSAAVRGASVGNDAAVTPSQLRAAMDAEKPLQFFARFVDERGESISEFSAQFEHGDDPEIDLAFSGPGFARVGEIKGPKQAWLKFDDQANQDLVNALKKRWARIRGEADEDWKKKEECLVEVLCKDGRLPELELEAEKKHTFMLRPPVALARLHGMYFDTNKCFLLPTAVASLKRLVETYALHLDSEVLIVGHTDTAGSEAFNLDLSADRADALKAFLRDDADAWLDWYDDSVRDSKRWGRHEDLLMIDALVPDEEFGEGSHVVSYQAWHNGEAADLRQQDQQRTRPDGWEELKVDGILGPKTRRQLILDYMNLDGTSLDDDVRIVTYGCGESFPLESEEGDVAEEADDDAQVQFDRRVEVFFFAEPFGVLPPVPGVAEGESSKRATKAPKEDKLYPEWRQRVARQYVIDTESDFRVRLCNYKMVPYAKRPFALCLEGYPEIRGETDEGGFVNVDSPPAGAEGTIEVRPDEDSPDHVVRWEIKISPVISPVTPLGASTRLANLEYFFDEPTDEMTDELRDAIAWFQFDEGLKVTSELDDDTCAKLLGLHDCEDEQTPDADDDVGAEDPSAEANDAAGEDPGQ